MLWRGGGGGADCVQGGEARGLKLVREEVHHAVEGGAGHDVDEETVGVSWMVGYEWSAGTHLVTLSREWKTREFLHIAMAIALLPNARQYVLMKRRFEFGKTQMLSMQRKLTK